MKNKSLFSRLLDNKKLLIIIAFVFSFFFWIISSDGITKTIADVPVTFSLPESVAQELKVYSNEVDTVSLQVTGKRVIVESLTADDFTATVDLSSITEPCAETSYQLTAENKGNHDIEIEGIDPQSINLLIDREATKTVNIVSNFTYSPEGYYVDNNVPETVDITGPETLINKVKVAYISGNVNSPNATNVTNTYDIKLYSTDDPTANNAEEIPTEYITMSMSSVDVSFRYLKIDEDMPFSLKYTPENVKLSASYYSITPSTISVAGPEELIEGNQALEKFAIDIGSLSQYKNQIYNEEFSVSEILGKEFVNKSDGVETIKVQLDFSYLDSEIFDVPASRITVKNLPSGYTYSAPTNFPVTAIGTASALSKLTEESFTIVYDFSGIEGTTDTNVDVPVYITVNSNGLCWVYRTSETASVQLEETE
ncbi:MAG: hypothetical protein IJC86_02890 [Clostridia bacterium]|nr:hypothetical protein [Clostridia bacterium]